MWRLKERVKAEILPIFTTDYFCDSHSLSVFYLVHRSLNTALLRDYLRQERSNELSGLTRWDTETTGDLVGADQLNEMLL